MSIINPMKLSNVLNMAQLVNGRDKNSNLCLTPEPTFLPLQQDIIRAVGS